jgi:hypothetical protein
MRNCATDQGGPFAFSNEVLISNYRKLLGQRVVNVAEKSEQDLDECD